MKTRQKTLLVFLTVALVTIPLFASFAKAAPIVLRAVTFLPMNHPNVDPWVKMMIDRVNKEAKGELTIKWLGGPEVIKAFDQTNALKTGVVEMLPYHPFGYMAPLMKEGHCGGLTDLTGWEEKKSGAFQLWDEIIQKKINAKYLGRVHTGPGIQEQ